MPFYSYECPEGHRFDDLKPVARMDEETPCEVCQSVAVRVPTTASPPTGGDTPKFFPGRF